METARDVAETLIATNAQVPVHSLEKYYVPPKNWEDHPEDFQSNCISQLEVYMDDFIAMSQCAPQLNLITSPVAFYIPCTASFHHPRFQCTGVLIKYPSKNCNKERDFWNSVRLSWVGYLMVLNEQLLYQLKKLTLISKEIKAGYRKKAIPLQRYQQLVGKLRHASFGIPTVNVLFTPLHVALKGNKQYIKLTSLLIATLRDWRVITNITLHDPVRARQLFPREPEFIGECDACQYGI